jgi:hypothetical protein
MDHMYGYDEDNLIYKSNIPNEGNMQVHHVKSVDDGKKIERYITAVVDFKTERISDLGLPKELIADS